MILLYCCCLLFTLSLSKTSKCKNDPAPCNTLWATLLVSEALEFDAESSTGLTLFFVLQIFIANFTSSQKASQYEI